ncbi:Holliday junction resolvase-like protein [Acinetobacter populi]|jgi:predicted Holliday junction resolvase-like endonuclease|uniref:Endonuclease n=1 Tax=Acinetobacter populi TaxID=1582270 RepID=A0A1Z9Z2U8_9GAMM|nr:Holliday junction resolvase-like protein [Acinetobacter populi]MCH4248020.1 endonuclease [Acinetobacter populi]OUY08803.1 endonuclease [Acinetobacter populi]
MSVPVALLIGMMVGILFSSVWFFFGRLQQLKAEHQYEMSELMREHDAALTLARKRSVNTSRAVLKGKMAEQFAPLFPEFDYLPSDAKFLGDPVDYVVFSGYSEYREGLCDAEDIEVIFIDIKSGQARLTKGQQAIAQAIEEGRVRFETVRIEFEEE